MPPMAGQDKIWDIGVMGVVVLGRLDKNTENCFFLSLSDLDIGLHSLPSI